MALLQSVVGSWLGVCMMFSLLAMTSVCLKPFLCVCKDLKDYMRQAGEVTYADAHKQKRNEGVVEFATFSDMKNALEKLDSTELNGRKIKLIEDKSKKRRTRSRSRSSKSRSRSASRSRSRSRSHSKSRSRSRSHSKSASRSRSKSQSRSKSRSRSKSPRDNNDQNNDNQNDDRSKSRSKSPDDDRSSEKAQD